VPVTYADRHRDDELQVTNDSTLIGKFDGEASGSSTTCASTGRLRYTW
jgi:hypothetical protein